MIEIIYKDTDLKELIEEGKNKKYEKLSRDKKFMDSLRKQIAIMSAANKVSEFKDFSMLHYEQLKYCNASSVRIQNNRVERIIFTENENGIEITLLELNTNHYGSTK